MTKKKNKSSRYKSDEEAALFWEKHEVLDHVDPNDFKVIKDPQKSRSLAFRKKGKKSPKLLVSLRIQSNLIEKAKNLGKRRGVGYQSVLKQWLTKGAA